MKCQCKDFVNHPHHSGLNNKCPNKATYEVTGWYTKFNACEECAKTYPDKYKRKIVE